MNKTTSQILQEARALIEAGWCQGPFSTTINRQACYCTVGAVMAALDLSVWVSNTFLSTAYQETLETLDRAARTISHGRFTTAVQYNEARGRTKEQVLALFDRALTEVTK